VSPERLTGLDASFLYMETPTLHMHVAMVAVFDPATVPDGYSFRRIRQMIVDRIPWCPSFNAGWWRCPCGWGTPSGWMIPSSISTTTCGGPRCPRRVGCASSPTLRPMSPAGSCTVTGPCGRCGSSRRSKTARSHSSPRCTTPRSTACPGRSSSASCSTSCPIHRSPRTRASASSTCASRPPSSWCRTPWWPICSDRSTSGAWPGARPWPSPAYAGCGRAERVRRRSR
jgi:hypothetical protein